jgi:hypothetical protein
MELSSYNNLIRHLPYLDQAFETSKATWNAKKYSFSPVFTKFYKQTFSKKDSAKFSRADLFDVANTDFYFAIFSIIFWGYPRNMRGNHFKNILIYLDTLYNILSIKKELTEKEFKTMATQLRSTGAGLSTLSKFLYFFKFKIDGYDCLILDSRIIEVLKSGYYEELHALQSISEFNKLGNYLLYLKLMKQVADENGYSIDQLELFLFMFGKNLKSSIA